MTGILQHLGFFRNVSKFSSISKLKSVTWRPSPHRQFYMPFDKLAKLNKDILLYSYTEESKFFKYLSMFGLAQLLFWGFWGTTLYLDTKALQKAPDQKSLDYMKKHPILRRVNFEDKKFGIIALTSCLTIGIGTAAITFILPSRIVKTLILCKGGEKAIFTTYKPFGSAQAFAVPLNHLSCKTTRENSRAYVSLKVKGRLFHFLLDVRGKFTDPYLFDYTVGTIKTKK